MQPQTMLPPTTKILVTGVNGQVGNSVVKRLSGRVELLAADRTTLDITQRQAVFDTVQAFSPNVVINAAAYTAVDKAESEAELAHAVNADGAKYLAQAAQSVEATLLHISTDYVFDGTKNTPYHEDDATNPQSVYGKSKHDGELAVTAHCDKAIILRTSWVFSEHGNNFVKTMLRLGAEREELGIVSDQRGAPTYAGDIADTLIMIAKTLLSGDSADYGIYHYSGQPYVSWYDFAKVIFRQAVSQSVLVHSPTLNAIMTKDYLTSAKRPMNSCLDCGKIQQTFFVPTSHWEKALINIERLNKN